MGGGSESNGAQRTGGSWLRALLGIAMITLGAGAFLIGSSLEAGGARNVGGNLPINQGARDKTDINAHNSPTVARNPRNPSNLVVVNRIDTPRFSCGMHVSNDAGATWKDAKIPFPAGEELPERCFAPDAAFDKDATLYVSFVTLVGQGNRPNAFWLSTSDDGGKTLSTPAKILGPSPPFFFQTRLIADPAKAGHLFATWLQADDTGNLAFSNTGNPIMFLRSVDGGATWIGPTQVSPDSRQRIVTPSPALGPDGEIYVSYVDMGDDKLDYEGAHEGKGGEPYDGTWSLVLAKSTDDGENWQESVIDQQVKPIERFIVFFPAAPSMTVHPKSGAIYVAFHDARDGDADVYLWSSTDGGKRFSRATRVNDTPADDGTTQYLPKVSVAPKGRVDVVYYDRRSDPKDVLNEVSLQSSEDGGKTFGVRIRLSDPDKRFSSRIGFGSERGMPDLGSRLGLISTDETVLAVWTDTRGGTEASNKQDLGRAIVAFTQQSPLRPVLHYGGPVLILAGLLILLSWAMAGRKSTAG